MVLLFILCIISSIKNSNPTPIPSQLGDPPILDKAITIYNQIFLYPSIALYGIATILAICFFKPDDDDDPSKIAIIFQIFSAIILISASFLGYAGNSKLTTAFDKYLLKKIQDINTYNIENNIKNSFQKSASLTELLYDNMSNIDHNSKKEIKLLNNFSIKYDYAFSIDNGQYKLSLNKLYSKAYHDNNIYLINNLIEMDNSRKNILFYVTSFSTKYFEFSKSIKNTLQNIKNNKYTKNNNEINKNIYNITGNIQSSNENVQWYSPNFSYVMSTGILIHAIAYSIVFFFNNKFSRCCFCLYPLFALAITGMTFFTCYFMTSSTYKNLIKGCKRQSNININDIEKLINDIKKEFFNFKIDEKLEDSFNDKNEIEKLYHFIDSENIHKNYISIYLQYAIYPNYRDDLIKIVQIINENEFLLSKMRKLLLDISSNSFSIVPMIKNTQGEIETLFNILNNFEISKMPNSCNTIINGVNCATIGCFLLIFGLLFMGISVCLRRVNMEDRRRVSNVEIEKKPLHNLQTTFIGEKIAYFAVYIKSVESISIIRAELSTPDCIITYLRGQYKNSLSIQSFLYRNDLFGEGFYFSSTKKDAILELATNIGHEMKLDQIILIVCQVDFGESLIVPFDKLEYFSYPSSLESYSCKSVSGSNKNLCEFVVYDMDQIVPLKFDLATLADIE